MKAGSLHLLEPSGPHRAGYGTPLPYIITLFGRNVDFMVLNRAVSRLTIITLVFEGLNLEGGFIFNQ